jgi:hypothetical protein
MLTRCAYRLIIFASMFSERRFERRVVSPVAARVSSLRGLTLALGLLLGILPLNLRGLLLISHPAAG